VIKEVMVAGKEGDGSFGTGI